MPLSQLHDVSSGPVPRFTQPGLLSSPVVTWSIVLAIVAAGLLLRIYRLDFASASGDEIFSLTVSRLPLSDLTGALVKDFVHPPLHYYLLNFWFRIFGFGVPQARVVSVIFGTASVLLIYLLARDLFDSRIGILSALLLSVSQQAIYYAQDARPYAMFLFLAVSSVYLFVISLRERSRLAWGGFICSSVLMIYTHYYGIFVLLALLAYFLLYRNRHSQPYSRVALTLAMMAACYVPWLSTGVVESALDSDKARLGTRATWFAVHFTTPLHDLNKFNNGAADGIWESAPRWSFPAGVLLFTLPVILALVSGAGRERTALVALLWLIPHGVLLALGALGMQYELRYVLFSLVPYYILVSLGISAVPWRGVRACLIALILAYSVYALRANYFLPDNDDYRGALTYVASHAREGDCSSSSSVDILSAAWSVYGNGRRLPESVNVEPAAPHPDTCRRLWVVREFRLGLPSPGALHRLENAYIPVETRHFTRIDVVLYRPRPSASR